MNTTTFRINWDKLSRAFVGLLFVYSGWTKIQSFEATTAYINSVLKTGNITPIITAAAIFIEVVVALLYVWGGYKKDLMGYILIAFTAVATVFFHLDLTNPANVIQAFKNLAIIGGMFATLEAVHKRRVLHHK